MGLLSKKLSQNILTGHVVLIQELYSVNRLLRMGILPQNNEKYFFLILSKQSETYEVWVFWNTIVSVLHNVCTLCVWKNLKYKLEIKVNHGEKYKNVALKTSKTQQ